MNLNNRKGTCFDQVKFAVASRLCNENGGVDLEFMFAAMTIGTKESSVNEGLAMASECDNVCDEWNVEEHVAVED